jgi:exosortase/archaeosortase family protein
VGGGLLLLNIPPATKRTSPIKTQIWAASTSFNRYKEAPTHRSKMPSSKTLETKNHPLRKIIPYMFAAAIIILMIYYLPNYFFLEKATADHTAFLLNSLGMGVKTKVVSENVFLANIKIVKDCTGVQVIAVCFGMLIPIPNAPLKKKLLTLVIVSTFLYVSNVLRIALEFSLVYLKILPWSLAHYPLSLLLGIIGVFMLVFVSYHLLPEFGDFLLSFARPRTA